MNVSLENIGTELSRKLSHVCTGYCVLGTKLQVPVHIFTLLRITSRQNEFHFTYIEFGIVGIFTIKALTLNNA